MTYEVVLTKDAENDLDNFIQYLLFEKYVGSVLYCFPLFNVNCATDCSISFSPQNPVIREIYYLL